MKKIGIVICNYNKCDLTLKCIQSVLESKIQDFDIYVVDNASTDHSVERIGKLYGSRVHLLINHQNLGGSGGFNTGIRKVVETGYEYLMCLDSDVQVDENAVGALYSFLCSHPEVGMAGSKVYHMKAPEYIQQFGLNIDFDHLGAETLYADVLDSEKIPEVVYCDSVAACSVMLPVKVVKEVGGLPEDNFIYWDDMEWGYLVKQAGYKVAACGGSTVLHEMGAFTARQSSFIAYYQWRNSMNFFMKYTPEQKLPEMSIRLLSSLFHGIYESMYRQEHAIVRTMLFAYQDAINGIRGKAMEGKILPFTVQETALERLLRLNATYWLAEEDQELENMIKTVNPSIRKMDQQEKAELRIKRCPHIMELKDDSLEYCYVDEDYNAAFDQDDIEAIRNYPYSLELFLYMNQPQFLYAAGQIRKREK